MEEVVVTLLKSKRKLVTALNGVRQGTALQEINVHLHLATLLIINRGMQSKDLLMRRPAALLPVLNLRAKARRKAKIRHLLPAEDAPENDRKDQEGARKVVSHALDPALMAPEREAKEKELDHLPLLVREVLRLQAFEISLHAFDG